MDLYLIRHGQSGSGESEGFSLVPNGTSQKTLTAAGVIEIERTSNALKTLNIIPDAIVTSPLEHARHSAEIAGSILFANKGGTDGKPKKKILRSVQVWNDLAPEGDRAVVYKNLAKFKYDTKILVVGHEPFLTKMAADIVSSSSSPNPHRGVRRSMLHTYPNLEDDTSNHHRSIVLKRPGLARISINSMNPKLKGELRWLLTPMLLKVITLIKSSEKKRRRKKNQMLSHYPPITSSSDFTTTFKPKSAATAINQ
jgi:phosphohistidine phosphatase